MARMSKGAMAMKRERPESDRLPGHRCLWHILDSGIPCRVASQQSPTPFPRANSIFGVWLRAVKRIAWRFFLGERRTMQDHQLYQQILGITAPWRVENVELRLKEGEVHVYLGHEPQAFVDVSGMSGGVPFVRPRLGAALAASGHLPIPHHPARRRSPRAVVRSTGSAWCVCLGPSPTAASPRCSSVWRSTG